jgi:polyhydroxyalkanoate synthase
MTAAIDWQAVAGEYEKMARFLAAAPRLKKLRDEVRDQMGRTPRDLLYSEHSVTVHRYRPGARAGRRRSGRGASPPMLVVPSLINLPCIMDLLPGESFIEAMLARGVAVYMLEWGVPNPGQKDLPLSFYLDAYLGRAVRRVAADSGSAGIVLAGYCLGGLLSLLYASRHPGPPVAGLVSMVAPVNFHDRGMLSWWANREHFDVDRIARAFGNIPARFFSSVFPWLVPLSGARRLRAVYERMDDEPFLRSLLALDLWITENVPFPGEVYRQIVRHGYQENALVERGAWPFEGGDVPVSRVSIPVLNVVARQDHVSPAESCARLGELGVSGPVTTRIHETGHLGIALGKDGRGQHTDEYWDEIATWLAAAARRSSRPWKRPPR